jgi:uncharacterized Fe-S cluster protein YjdI
MARRLQLYETPEITVTFEPDLCTHSGVCVRGLPAVFDVRRRRWVMLELGAASEIAAQVQRCPSGALKFRLPDSVSEARSDDGLAGATDG